MERKWQHRYQRRIAAIQRALVQNAITDSAWVVLRETRFRTRIVAVIPESQEYQVEENGNLQFRRQRDQFAALWRTYGGYGRKRLVIAVHPTVADLAQFELHGEPWAAFFCADHGYTSLHAIPVIP